MEAVLLCRMAEVFQFKHPYPEVNVTPEIRQQGYESFAIFMFDNIHKVLLLSFSPERHSRSGGF